jgi:hypothetical protein
MERASHGRHQRLPLWSVRQAANRPLRQRVHRHRPLVVLGHQRVLHFAVSWVAPGIPGREAESGCARRVPQSPHVPAAEQSRVPNCARMLLQ